MGECLIWRTIAGATVAVTGLGLAALTTATVLGLVLMAQAVVASRPLVGFASADGGTDR